MEKTVVQQFVEDPEQRRLFQQEWSINSVTGLICQRMEEQGVSRTELAKRMNVTPSWITQLLDGEANKTVRTLSDVFFALDRVLEFHDRPLADITDRSTDDTIAAYVNLSFVIAPASVKSESTQSDRTFDKYGIKVLQPI